MRKIQIALPKGQRLLGKTYQLFKEAGYMSAELEAEIAKKSRKQLEFTSDCGRVTFLLVRIADIPQYVDKNWADMGVSAFDCYREYELASSSGGSHSMRGDNFVSDLLPNLNLCANTRFCVAGLPERQGFYEKCKQDHDKIMTVATQHPYLAAKYFAGMGMAVDIITITGSSEIMPKHADVDVIFDIVETGRALEENGLVIFEEAMAIQTKLLVSRAALKYDPQIPTVIEELKNALK
ncbi:MAG: ATP phosphoribosyltransferase [Oscillospiraceae bacterium]|nr:ATP phosphoribosyltransferase [Oscillospiraceae bacterium]